MEQIEELQQSKEILNLFESLQVINTNTIVNEIVDTKFPINGELRNNEMCFYRVNQLSFDEDYPHREAFENVLLSMDNEAFNFVYIFSWSLLRRADAVLLYFPQARHAQRKTATDRIAAASVSYPCVPWILIRRTAKRHPVLLRAYRRCTVRVPEPVL